MLHKECQGVFQDSLPRPFDCFSHSNLIPAPLEHWFLSDHPTSVADLSLSDVFHVHHFFRAM